jgi:hypothetical protein
MKPVTLSSPGTAPAGAYLDAARRLKGDAIAASEYSSTRDKRNLACAMADPNRV